MNKYVAARPDVFFNGADGSLRSNRVLCQLAGQYAIDMFIGSTLQMDADANSSTVTESTRGFSPFAPQREPATSGTPARSVYCWRRERRASRRRVVGNVVRGRPRSASIRRVDAC